MTDTPPTPQNRPLVTFALFAYNQEKYIREAVEGAFSQTYKPLEIILSDDCSSDQTYQIMQEMAAAYEGPHQVRVRQSSKNRGTLGHVLDVAKEAMGALFVVAAGDDVSICNRTEILWNSFRITRPSAVYSGVKSLGGDEYLQAKRTFKCIFSHQTHYYGLGASAAYNTEIFKNIPSPSSSILHEDVFLASLISLHGWAVSWVEMPLVVYRMNDSPNNKLTFKEQFEIIEKHISNRIVRITYYINLLQYCRVNAYELLRLSSKNVQPSMKLLKSEDVSVKNIDTELSRLNAILAFYQKGLPTALFGLTKVNKNDFPEILRISLGWKVFATIKAFHLSVSR